MELSKILELVYKGDSLIVRGMDYVVDVLKMFIYNTFYAGDLGKGVKVSDLGRAQNQQQMRMVICAFRLRPSWSSRLQS